MEKKLIFRFKKVKKIESKKQRKNNRDKCSLIKENYNKSVFL